MNARAICSGQSNPNILPATQMAVDGSDGKHQRVAEPVVQPCAEVVADDRLQSHAYAEDYGDKQ